MSEIYVVICNAMYVGRERMVWAKALGLSDSLDVPILEKKR
jgi:hypothetical protein